MDGIHSAFPLLSPRLLKAARYGLVLFVGLALGVAVAAPGFVERSVERVITKVERKLSIDIDVDTFDWSFSGDLSFQGVRVRDAEAREGETELLQAAEVQATVDLLWTRAKVRVKTLSVTSPTLRPALRSDGSHNLQGVVDQLKRLVASRKGEEDRAPSDDGLSAWLDLSIPELSVSDLQIFMQNNHAGAQSAGLPGELSFRGGRFDASNTALLREDDNLSWALSFEDSSFDPGHGFVLKGAFPLRGFDPLRVPIDLRFDRRVEVGIGERSAGVAGLTWDGSELVLEGLTLSRNAALEDDGQGSQEPALQSASITLEPDVEASLAAARALLDSSDRSSALSRLLKTIRRVDVDRPRFVFKRRAEGHNFQDLVPARAKQRSTVDEVDDQALGPLMRATLGAIERLNARKPDANGRSFRAFLVRGFGHLERRISGVSKLALSVAESVPFRQVRVRGGHFAWRDELDQKAKALEERFENFDLDLALGDDVLTFEAAFQVAGGGKDINHITGKVQRTSGGVQLRARMDALALTKYRHALPASLRITPDTRLFNTDVTLVWSPTTQQARVGGRIGVDDLGFHYAPLASKPLSGLDFELDFEAKLDMSAKRLVLEQSKLKVGETRSVVKLEASDYQTAPQLQGVFRLHRARAQDVVDAIPTELIPLLEGLKVKGTFAWQLDFSLDTNDMESLTYEAFPELNQFEVLDMGKRLNIDAVRGTFAHRILKANGEQGEMLIGPDSPNWVPIGRISRYMVKAVTTTEDGSFFRHEGFSPFHIRQSIITNLKKGGFVRGASTISQQLTKNLFLTREKTISRKLQELFITWQLESNLDKNQIMELYLNVIEFGPGIYGIKRAARHYFGKQAGALSPLDAAFLASIIPSPKRYYYQFTRGEVTDRWRRRLRWIMRVMVDRGKITEEEFLDAAPYSPLFRSRAPEGDEQEAPSPSPDAPGPQ